MAVKVAINGFGRIGRLAFRQMFGMCIRDRVASGAPMFSKIGPNAEAVPTPPDIAEEEHCRARSG